MYSFLLACIARQTVSRLQTRETLLVNWYVRCIMLLIVENYNQRGRRGCWNTQERERENRDQTKHQARHQGKRKPADARDKYVMRTDGGQEARSRVIFPAEEFSFVNPFGKRSRPLHTVDRETIS
jgi:hypothetical protein